MRFPDLIRALRCSTMLSEITLGVALLGAAIAGPAPSPDTIPSPLTRSANAFSERADVNAVTSVLDSSTEGWAAVDGLDRFVLEGVPLAPGLDVDVALRRIDPLAPGGAVVLASMDRNGLLAQTPLAADVTCWSGTALGHDGSRFFLAKSSSFVHGYAIVDGHTHLISSGPPGGGLPIVSFDLNALPGDAITWSPFNCETLITGVFPQVPSEGGVSGELPCRQIKIAIDSDTELAAVFNGDAAATASYMLLQAAAMNEIYVATLNIRIQASYVRVWSGTDPWTASGSAQQLYDFRDYWEALMQNVDRDVATLLSARNLGGGIAWLDAMCGSNAYNVCGNLAGWFPYPLQDNAAQNWDCMVTAHELGHNVGTPHTHNFCPPVDECAPAGYFGQCQSQQVCTNEGTIMSYCHLCSGGLANVVLDFAPACIDAINAHLSNVPCEFEGDALPPWAVPDLAWATQAPITIDVLANDLAANCDELVIDSFTQPSGGTGVISLSPGSGADGRDQLVFTAPAWWGGTTEFTYVVREPNGALSDPGKVTVTIPALWPGKSVINTQPSLTVMYYNLNNPIKLPFFDFLNPFLITTTPNIDYPSTNGNFANSNKADNFGALWTGWVWIPEDGFYTFYAESDDGSKILIDDTVVVLNDGLHGMVEKSGNAPLAKGRHKIRVEFFEAGGGAGCIVSMSGPGMPKTVIPAASLSRLGTILASDLTMDGAVNGADISVLLGLWNTPAALGDINHDGTVDGGDIAALLGAWTG